ncbi:MAG: hypothetical protein LWY06_01410 [Firmicutes bacterium]|nr:hypothetical protein [Bacillota bacterium]
MEMRTNPGQIGSMPAYFAPTGSNSAARPSAPPVLSDKVDLTDGANNLVELALLPSVDMIIGQAVSEKIQKGSTAKIEGKITTDNGAKQLAKIDFEMKPDQAHTALDTTGAFIADEASNKGTFIKERTTQNPTNMFMTDINGTVSPDPANQTQNETIKTQAGYGTFGIQGQINGFNVQGAMNLDVYGNLYQSGIIAGQEFTRQISPDYATGGANIKGQMGNMEERGVVSMVDGAILINRNIGPYNIQEKITFTGGTREA